MEKKEKQVEKNWYYRIWAIVIAMLFFGPLALFLLWFRPNTKIYIKITVTIIVLLLTVWTTHGATKYYQLMMQHYEELAEVMK